VGYSERQQEVWEESVLNRALEKGKDVMFLQREDKELCRNEPIGRSLAEMIQCTEDRTE
jgi:hypothetical protein